MYDAVASLIVLAEVWNCGQK